MELYFVTILVFLLVLTVFDIFVGVSNDAVNFMNSAVGSRVASLRVILIVSALGVLLGSTFSSGMMEIARSGVFNPQMFTFQEIMIVFLAVMIADVLLLDVFNSFGIPTSTTVSIVFELLGAAVVVAALKLYYNPDTSQTIVDFINHKKTIVIISAILTSVIVAFTSGIVVQYVTRLIFTFKYQNIYRYVGSVFGGIAVSSILYFLVMKGAKGASFMRPEHIEWISTNTITLLLMIFLASTLIFQLLITFFKTNIFVFIILFGTFALAFAFAGNDLVNFVGVPLAALDSFKAYSASGMAADVMTMEMLLGAIKSPTGYLLLSGLIMAVTLFISKKAKRVIQTEVSLSSSSRGVKEKFGSSAIARAVVRSSFGAVKMINQYIPLGMSRFINRRMVKVKPKRGEVPLPFDHVRATINLVVSSILIASATSLKLPLSTTYVTFMVAMGSSLADGAWDRESAVYRVSGVLSIIGAWFLTAVCAFTLCGLTAATLYFGGTWAAGVLMLLVTIILVKSNFFPKSKEDPLAFEFGKADKVTICNSVNNAISQYFNSMLSMYDDVIKAFQDEDHIKLRAIKNQAAQLHEEIARKRADYYRFAYEGDEDQVSRDSRYFYYRVFTNLKEIGHGLRGVAGMAHNHINNSHSNYRGTLQKNLFEMIAELDNLRAFLEEYGLATSKNDQQVPERTQKSITFIDQLQHQMITRIDRHNLSLRGSELYLSYLQFSRDIINRFSLIALLQHELNERCGASPAKDD